jgi:protein SCO1/2
VQPHKLIDQHAHEVLFPSGAGAWQLVVFGYTRCPDVCPMTLHKTKLLLHELGADSALLRVVFISIDSARDDTRSMKEFVEKFDTRIIGLTGDPEVLQAVANEFGVLTRRFQGKTAIAYTMVHSSLLYLLDKEGRVQMMYPGGIGSDVLAADLRRLWQAERTAVK